MSGLAAADVVRRDQPRARRGAVALLSIGHAVDDLYQGAVPALVPFFVAAHHWSYAAASGITLAATVLASIVQPVFGVLTDRWRLPWLVPVGMSLAGLGIGLSGLSSSYWLTWFAIALSGVGVAIYHPGAARLARSASGGSHTGMGWFSLGGNVGFALAPVFVAPLLEAFGVTGTLPLLVPALVFAAITAVLLRSISMDPAKTRAAPVIGRDDWPAFGTLTAVLFARSVATFGLGTFLALYIEHRLNVSTRVGEAALVLFYGCGAAGTLLGGFLAGRWGRMRTVRLGYAITIPALAGLVFVPGPAMFGFVAISALAIYLPFSLHVTLGQDYLPNRIGTASGVTLGLGTSVGGLAAPVLGVIADAAGLQLALAVLIAMPVLAALLTLRMREP